MSRSNYSKDYDNVRSAIKGRRGQTFLREMLAALDAMSEKRLIAGALEEGDSVCALGSVGKARGVDMSKLDPEDSNTIAYTFDIAPALVREIVYENDEHYVYLRDETPESRFDRMRRWVARMIEENAHSPK